MNTSIVLTKNQITNKTKLNTWFRYFYVIWPEMNPTYPKALGTHTQAPKNTERIRDRCAYQQE